MSTKPTYSLAHLTALALSPLQLIDAAAAAGYDHVGLRATRITPTEPHYPLATDRALRRAVRERMAATGVRVWDVEVVRLDAQTLPEDHLPLLDAAAELGARHLIAHVLDPQLARGAARLARLCELAAQHGLGVNVEFLSWTCTPGLAEAAELVRAAAQPNAGVLVDCLHFARSRSRIALLRELPREWFRFAHVCDAPAEIPATAEGQMHTSRHARLLPGEGGIDIAGILGALPAGIPYGVEIPNDGSVARLGLAGHVLACLQAVRACVETQTMRRSDSRASISSGR